MKRLRIQGIHVGSSAFNRTDQGYPAASHTLVSTLSVRAPSSARASVPTERVPSRVLGLQYAYGVFSVVARGQAKFVQHFPFRLTICFAIPPMSNSEILPFPLAPQMNPPKIVFVSGYILNGATLSPSVTF